MVEATSTLATANECADDLIEKYLVDLDVPPAESRLPFDLTTGRAPEA